MDKISLFCFGASYTVALVLNILYQFKPLKLLNILEIVFALAGLFAQSWYLAWWQPPLAQQFGWFLLSSWILSTLYLYGIIHYRKIAWGTFVLPLIIGLVTLAAIFPPAVDASGNRIGGLVSNIKVLGLLHVGFLLTATVAICIGSLASFMYLLHSNQLKLKLAPGKGLAMLSLEKLEKLIRFSIATAFPLLSMGLLVGLYLMLKNIEKITGWEDPKVVGSSILWLAFLILIYARYGFHLRGKQLAGLTLTAFALLIICLILPHNIPQEVGK